MDFDKEQQTTATNELVIDSLPEGMQEITLRVGPGGGRTQRFVGRLLSQAHRVTTEGSETIRVYQSRKGKLVVHSHIIDWNDFATATKHAAQEKKEEFITAKNNSDSSDYSPIMNWAKGFKNWREMLGLDEDGYGDFTLDIVDSLGELRDRVPAKVYRIVADVVENPSTQVLDI
ncbi:EXLDI protein [Nocardia sp. CDC153]|uniref:EXLDI protein n=1 Tax=Nocardia sp. CDC153 TaxID=3112167 RepID=UPI002DBEF14C|nr:EXLDI protein [Nocardia sp. CDC153]MEC3955108.1 EXLDI protein [Nocardia sp. CDC153]